jgi:PAS domain S-box-containing protein
MDIRSLLDNEWFSIAIFLAGLGVMLGLVWVLRARLARAVRSEQEQRALAEALGDTAATLNSTLEFSEVLDRVLANTSRVVPNDAGAILLLDPALSAAQVARVRGYPPESQSIQQRRFVLADFANLRQMLETGRPKLIADTQQYADWVSLPETAWIRSNVAAPIRTKGQTLGFLRLDSAKPGFFTETHAARLQAFADQAAVAIENARLFEATRQRSVELGLISRVFAAFAEDKSLPASLTRVAAELTRALPASLAVVALLNPDRTRLSVVAVAPPDPTAPELNGAPLPLKSLPAALQAFATRQAVVVAEAPTNALITPWQPFLRARRIALLQVFPLITANEVIGVVALGLSEPGRTLLADEVRLAETVLVQTAVAIQNVWLLEQAQRELNERKQTEAALRESEARFRVLSEHSVVGVYIIREAQFVYANPALAQIFGYTPDEFSRLSPAELIHAEDRSGIVESIQTRLNADPAQLHYSFRGLRKEGATLHCEVYGQIVEYQGQRSIVGTLVDVTERALVEEQLRVRTTALETAANAVLIANRNGEILWVNPAFEELTGYPAEEIAGKTPRVLNSGMHEPAFYKQMWDTILAGEVWRGEVINRHKDGHIYIEEQTITPVHGRGEGITHFIAVKQDVTYRKQRDREREVVLEVASAMRVAQTRAEILPVLLDQLLHRLSAEGAAVALHDPAQAMIVIELGRGAWAPATGLRFAEDGRVIDIVLKERQPYQGEFMSEEDRLAWPEFVRDLASVAGVPLVAQDTSIGVLWLGRKTPISQDELHVLAAIGDMAANALHRATLHEQTERRLQRLEALRAIEGAILSSVDVHATLTVLLDEVTARLGIHAADVLLLNAQTQILEVVAARGFRETNIRGLQVMIGRGRAGRAALEHHPIHVPNVVAPERMGTRTRLLVSENFSAYFAVPLVVKGQIKGVLELFHRAPLPADQEWMDFLESLGNGVAIAIDNAELVDSLQRSNAELALAYETTLEGWSRALDLRDRETEGHTQRVTEMTVRLARAMGLDENRLVHMRRGALLHDIGKMGIPDKILLKTGPLTDPEWSVMRQHPVYAYEMLSPIEFLRPALDIPYCHHERWDGKGYPRGLKGEQIPLAARVFAVVDVWDALRSGRPYREAWPDDMVREYIRSHRGTHFDPQVVDAFLRLTDVSPSA